MDPGIRIPAKCHGFPNTGEKKIPSEVKKMEECEMFRKAYKELIEQTSCAAPKPDASKVQPGADVP
jgi:hypothetical protein